MIESQCQCRKWNNDVRPECKRTINGFKWFHSIEFGHDAESNSGEHEDMGFHKQ